MMPKRKRKSDEQPSSKDLKPRSQKIEPKVSDKSICSENADASIWVQCENKNCLKWRKITEEELEKVGDGSWYCSMNWDSHFNRCSAPEKIAKLPKHMKYIYSLLPKAEIVMARIPGYPLWPGLLTPDPTCGEYYDALLEKQDQPIQYHVEFLGKPHSRAWVRPKMVHPYNAITDNEKLLPLQKGPSKLLTSYRAALEEAKRLLSVSASERLKLSCQFKYIENETDSDTCKSVPKKTADNQTSVVYEPKEDCTTDSYSDFDEYLSSPDEQQTSDSPESSSSSCRYFTRFNKKKKNYPRRAENQLEPAEEFFNSLKEILVQKGLPPPRHPKWKDQHISLLSFYTVVQQQGGFETVCRSRLWNQIYSSLVKTDGMVGNSGIGNMGNKVRLFYQRHLLPYEVHVKNLQQNESHFVPVLGPTLPVNCNKQKPLVSLAKKERSTSTSTLGSDSEQKVPVHVNAENIESPASSSALGDLSESPEPQYTPTVDCVPSSNPNSPLTYEGVTSDSEDDDDLGIDCRSAEYELQQLERLLSSIEPSLYPPQAQETSDKRRPSQETTPLNSSSLSGDSPLSSGVDVLKTLDEMSRIEGTIADLDTMVSLELENL